MKELSKKGEKFNTRWEKRREKKWRFVIIQGLYHTIWGLILIVLVFIWNGKFETENLNLLNFFYLLPILFIFGIFNGLRDFKRNEKRYIDLLNAKDKDEEVIMKGIQSLKAGKPWSYESLKIQTETDESLLIQNELFWFDEQVTSSEKLEECYQAVYGDFQRLQKNQNFKEYAKNRKVTIQIFDNSPGNIPLLEKIM